ncbi:MAG: hypothetical protein ACOCQC_03660, partial [Halanaerobiaceae bacterium]
ISYDAREVLGAEAALQGEISFDNPFGSSDVDYTVEDGVVKFRTKPLEVDISASELDRMLEDSIKDEDSYLYVEFDSDFEPEIETIFYFGDSGESDELYVEDNEVTTINSEDLKDGRKITIGEHIQDFREQLEDAPVYLGVRFKVGEKDKKEYSFNIDDRYKLHSYLGVVVGVN